MEILIDNRQDKVEMDEDIQAIINRSIRAVLDYENIEEEYEVSVSFVDNQEIREINSEFRDVDKETDVLSFPLEQDFLIEGEIPILGDIIISCEKALEQAKEYGHDFKREISYLTVHSSLHLLGYDHIDEDEKDLMRNKEKEIMKILKIFK